MPFDLLQESPEGLADGGHLDVLMKDIDGVGDPEVFILWQGGVWIAPTAGDGQVLLDLSEIGGRGMGDCSQMTAFQSAPLVAFACAEQPPGFSSGIQILSFEDGGLSPDELDWTSDAAGADGVLSVAVGDVNGDDLEDLVAGPTTNAALAGGAELRIWLRDDAGYTFTKDLELDATGTNSTQAITLGDIDEDGDLDIVSSHHDAIGARGTSGTNLIWLNQGGAQGGTEGSFALSSADLGDAFSTRVLLADLDNDDDLDAVLANGSFGFDPCTAVEPPAETPDTVWLNQGGLQAGTLGDFANTGAAIGTSHSTDAVLVNVDGQIGVLLTSLEDDDRLYVNNGGNLVEKQVFTNLRTTAAAAGDLDGDGDSDLFFALDFFGSSVIGCDDQEVEHRSAIYRREGLSVTGVCVECLDNADCPLGETCVNDQCTGTRSAASFTRWLERHEGRRGADPFGNGAPPMLTLANPDSGFATKHTFTFGAAAGDLETHQFVVHYPFAFTWNGFNALGPVGSEIGTLTIEEGSSVVFTAPLVAFDAGLAFIDLDSNGAPTNDIGVGYRSTSSHRLTATFPWGEGDPSTLTNDADRTFTLELSEGLFSNPAVSGNYTIQIEMISVDPDNDRFDDEAGSPPQSIVSEIVVPVVSVSDIFSDGFESGSTSSWN